ncbi:PqqD family peptide modification chaperone [Halomonas sp. LBP4]|uniref:PqqD family peptide modification chaperone n=1 Tax=Halomonas sp. LBP4 TaxID=2044917 RepID=UPI000D75692F|nr:PqqD family peptide modification chaperone [Halomonas sp. LBP4]PXX99971.1 amylase [Halomonas sp. LBP4]
MTEQHSPTRRFWLGGKRAAEQDRFFCEALEQLGWEAGDETHWDAGWVTGMPDAEQFHRVSPQRRLNHFPGNAALTVKSRLHDSLAVLRERIRESHGADSELAARLAFFPRAYVMPHDYHALQEAALANPGQRWILKPTNASKGKGIRVLRDVAEAPLAPDWMVQEYLANPHTIRGHKYVLRLYVLISAIEPLRVYLYRQGFAKLASEPWDPEDADNPYSQLTNPDINALNARAEVPVEFIDLDRYRQWLRDQGHDDDQLFARIHDLVALTVISAVDAIRQRTARAGADPRGCYELLGLDCLVDDTLKPWILECNLSPSLGICAGPESGGRIEEAVKGGLVRDMISLLDIDGAAPPADESSGADVSARLVAEAEAELARAGDFQRLFPAAEPSRYLPYFSLPALADIQLADGLAGRAVARPVLQRRHVAELLDDDQLALYATHTGRYYRPNDSAALIWLLATEGLDPDAIALELARAAVTEGDPPPDHQALRRDVWATLARWCRAGLLCQQGSMAVPASPTTGAGESRPTPTTVASSGRAMQLAFDGRRWALHVDSAPASARLSDLLEGRLVPLSDEAASRLPRLEVLRDPAGYTLATDGEVLASRLTLAQLGSALLAHLVRQAATADRLVIDAGLLVTPQGSGVLCLFPAGEQSGDALRQLVSASGGVLARGLRLTMAGAPRVEPLGLPMPEVAVGSPAGVPESVEIRSVLCMHPDGSPGAALDPASSLDVLGALLPCCVSVTGAPLDAHTVTALGEWLSGLDRRSLSPGEEEPSPTAVAAWLATLGEPGTSASRSDTATANG